MDNEMLNCECPTCGASHEVPNWRGHFTCRCCDKSWRIVPDAEFVDGAWRDLTTFAPMETAE